ncbi:hypothetical protein FOZ60_015397 [Perkinsus olseni]|uniref:Integrase catalytic domain-containing protein n=1 Tax=Perkinsus olseni TaxID=32597 RepID=A0A7J6N8F1_PEROL|nr:hypothetical protein FOZ60_015397 [Perkinsus olseni]
MTTGSEANHKSGLSSSGVTITSYKELWCDGGPKQSKRTGATDVLGIALRDSGVPKYPSMTYLVYRQVTLSDDVTKATWCNNIPQLYEYYASSDDQNLFKTFRDSIYTSKFPTAFQNLVQELQVKHALPTPVIVCLLLHEAYAGGDAALRQRTEAITMRILMSKDPDDYRCLLSEVSRYNGLVTSSPVDLSAVDNADNLPGLSAFSDDDAWNAFLYILSKSWCALSTTCMDPTSVRESWSSISQKNQEWVETFLARESDLWNEMVSYYEYKRIQPPSQYDRVIQIIKGVKSSIRASLSDDLRKDRILVEDISYANIVGRLLDIETRSTTYYPWEGAHSSDSKGAQPHQPNASSGTTTTATTKPPDRPSNTKTTKNDKLWCDICSKYGKHSTERCWENPNTAAVVPDWFKNKTSKASKDKSEKPEKPTTTIKEEQSEPNGEPPGNAQPRAALGFKAYLTDHQDFDDDSERATMVAIDSLCIPNLVDSSRVSEGWEPAHYDGASYVSSSGHSLNISGAVVVPVTVYPTDNAANRHRAPRTFTVRALVVEVSSMLVDCGLILGSDSLEKMKAVISFSEKTLPYDNLPAGTGASLSDSDLDPIEEKFMNATLDEVVEYCRGKLQGKPLPALDFELRHGTTPYQSPSSWNVPADLVESTHRTIDREIESGHWVELDPSNLEGDAWVSNAFVKPKGRLDGDGYQEIRVLIDLRKLNQSVDVPSHLKDGPLLPNPEDFVRNIPKGTTHYSLVDISSAFHGCRLSARASKYLTFWLCGRLIRSLTCSQGLALSALYWGRHLWSSFELIFTYWWHRWLSIFVDDLLIRGPTEARTRLRRRLVSGALIAMKKDISQKVPDTVDTKADVVGLHFEGGAYRLSDANLAKLVTAMETVPKNGEELRRLCGTLNWSISAFETTHFNDFAKEMKVLNGLVHAKPFRWEDSGGLEALENLKKIMKPRNLALHGMDDLVNGDSSGHVWVVHSDASDVAVGAGLFRAVAGNFYKKGADIDDRMRGSVLVSLFSKALSSSSLNWMTFEKECYALYLAARKWLPLFISTTRNSRLNSHRKLGPPVAFLTDSSTALKHWSTFTCSQDPFGSLKGQRFLSWASNISALRYVDHNIEHLPGSSNSLADTLSRIGHDFLKTAAAENQLQRPAFSCLSVPDDPRGSRLQSPGDLSAVAEALSKDESTFQGVEVREIYAYPQLQGGSSASKKAKVEAWFCSGVFKKVDDILYVLEVLVTPADADDNTDIPADLSNDTKHYLLVIPEDCSPIASLGHTGVDTLKQQLLYLAHDTIMSGSTHHGRAATIESILKSYWWPGLSSSVTDYISKCPVCVHDPRKGVKQSPMRTIPATARFKSIQIDHKEIPDSIKSRLKDLPKTACVLNVVDRYTGLMACELAMDHSAKESAFLLVRRWFSRFGPCQELCSDNGAAFVATLASVLSAMFNYRLKHSLPRHPQGNSMVERANSSLSLCFRYVEESGDCNTASDLSVHIGSAEFSHNLRNGAFRRVYGEDTPSALSLFGVTLLGSAPADGHLELDNKTESDLVKHITTSCALHCKEYQVDKQIRSHYNLISRVAANASKSGARPVFTIGDKVIYEGTNDVVVAISYCRITGRPISLRLASGGKVAPESCAFGGDERIIPQPTLAANRVRSEDGSKLSPKYFAGEHVLFLAESNETRSCYSIGEVLSTSTDGRVELHELDGGDSQRCFLPLWVSTSTNSKVQRFQRGAKCPPGYMAATTTVSLDDILFTVEVSPRGLMSEASKARMIASAIYMYDHYLTAKVMHEDMQEDTSQFYEEEDEEPAQ